MGGPGWLSSSPASVCHPAAAPNRRLPQRQLHGHGGDGPAERPGDLLPGLQPLPGPLPAALGPAGPDPEAVTGPGAADPRLPVQLHPYSEHSSSAAGNGLPLVTQGSLGGELHPNSTSRGFDDAGANSKDFISFDVDAGSWLARRGDNLALYARDLLNRDKGPASKIQFLLRTWVSELKSFVQHGKGSLERQGEVGHHSLPCSHLWERPVAVVFARAPPPAGTPAPLLLVCRVTGFYPRPVRVAWLQDGEEVGPGGRLSSSGILPNADLTYQLRSSLAVEPGDGHSYACRVEHSSLGGQSLPTPWEHSRRWGPGLAVGITLGVVAVAAVAVVLWRSRRRGY
ncbi:unnamed protein product [Natator depressus]